MLKYILFISLNLSLITPASALTPEELARNMRGFRACTTNRLDALEAFALAMSAYVNDYGQVSHWSPMHFDPEHRQLNVIREEIQAYTTRIYSLLDGNYFRQVEQHLEEFEIQIRAYYDRWISRPIPWSCTQAIWRFTHREVCSNLARLKRQLQNVVGNLERRPSLQCPDADGLPGPAVQITSLLREVQEGTTPPTPGAEPRCSTCDENGDDVGGTSVPVPTQTSVQLRAERVQQERERIEQLIAQREQRMRSLREAYDDRNRPANIPSRNELVRQTQAALQASAESDFNIPADFDVMMTRALIDANGRTPLLTQAQLASIRRRWNETIQRLRELSQSSEVTDPTQRLIEARNILVRDFLREYVEDDASPLSVLLGEGGNCQTQTFFMLSAFSQVPGLIPNDMELGVQSFRGHVQAVLIPRDRDQTSVYGLLQGETEGTRRGNIYRPTLAMREMLRAQGETVNVSEEQLLMAQTDPQYRPNGEPDVPDSMENSMSWGSPPANAVFAPGAQNPSEVTLRVISYNGEEHTRVRERMSDYNQMQRIPTRMGSQSQVSDSETSTTSTSLQQISGEERDQLITGTAHLQGLNTFLQENPNATRTEIERFADTQSATIASAILAEIRSNPETFISDQAIRTAYQNLRDYCNDSLIRVNSSCRSVPEVNELRDFVRTRARDIFTPETFINHIGSGDDYSVGPFNYFDLSEFLSDNFYFDSPNNLGPQLLRDTNPTSEVWDQVLSRNFLAPQLSVDEMANFHVSTRRGPGIGPIGPNSNGPGSSGTQTPQRRRAAFTAHSQYSVNLDTYVSMTSHYIQNRQGRRAERIELTRNLSSYMAIQYSRMTEEMRGRNQTREICGRIIIENDAILLESMAQELNLPSIPCP